ncbi:MAG: hypothetical protein A2X67_14285 [Ignavibacteria bacterium GWA2_55_11]|nr:MAG: hypothetical protein A2X67_14285 [Ignavibacteria bacterium GWA2_55_11]OGU66341.1 MAG: hypothetical protein A3C56_02060 [Ignavibacteria bacterium RIFCSPHIGHO2_02_FULL_56_12]OGU70739.1 MAG: hypothetical protein A3H45_02385 [Ignavibacteria bacterium RIFCSPLOWO2_02_FULL_55_14]OGU76088.1 MAG: hypothetical protein A3G43_11620 [Ignavibacteria bacterium RIFCSPLOWO2_12_FULL_56_21]
MRCPLLREAQVKFCRASAYTKLIVRTTDTSNNERCSTEAWSRCLAAKQHKEEHPSVARCPFLQESLVQYCSGAPISKYVPYSDAKIARCTDDRHKYCDVFAELASGEGSPKRTPSGESDRHVDIFHKALEIPDDVWLSPNHLWLSASADGYWHIGIDAFLAGVLGRVDRLGFPTSRGVQHPAAVLTIRDIDLHLVFPSPLQITESNSHLRASTDRITEEPYVGGWLLEGKWATTDSPTAGLRTGESARTWMIHEIKRLTEFVQHKNALSTQRLNDGGIVAVGVAQHLDRQDVLGLYNEFFCPHASWRIPL